MSPYTTLFRDNTLPDVSHLAVVDGDVNSQLSRTLRQLQWCCQLQGILRSCEGEQLRGAADCGVSVAGEADGEGSQVVGDVTVRKAQQQPQAACARSGSYRWQLDQFVMAVRTGPHQQTVRVAEAQCGNSSGDRQR